MTNAVVVGVGVGVVGVVVVVAAAAAAVVIIMMMMIVDNSYSALSSNSMYCTSNSRQKPPLHTFSQQTG